MKLSQYFVISCLIGIISPIMMATEERVVTLEGDIVRADVLGISKSQELLLRGQDPWPLEKIRTIIPSNTGEDLEPGRYTVWLTNGSRFSATEMSMDHETYHLQNPTLGTLDVPIDYVWAVRLGRAKPNSRFDKAVRAMAERNDDVIFVSVSGSTEMQETNGLLEELNDDDLVLDMDGELKALSSNTVHGVILASPMFEDDESEGWITCNLTLGDGSLLSGNVLSLKDGSVAIQLGEDLTWTVPWQSVQRFTVRSSLLHYLSDMDPIEMVSQSIYSFPREWRRDQNVRGRPLRLHAERFEKGLGVAAGTDLTFSNDGDYRLFTATIGVDAGRDTFGDCEFVIVNGTEELFRQRMRGGEEPRFVKLPVESLASVTLRVEAGQGGLDLSDDANWCEACFLELEKE
jgi:hypothetical protein